MDQGWREARRNLARKVKKLLFSLHSVSLARLGRRIAFDYPLLNSITAAEYLVVDATVQPFYGVGISPKLPCPMHGEARRHLRSLHKGNAGNTSIS
jgi:hypothetical protein